MVVEVLRPTHRTDVLEGVSSPTGTDWAAFEDLSPIEKNRLQACWSGEKRWPLFPWGDDKPVNIAAAHDADPETPRFRGIGLSE